MSKRITALCMLFFAIVQFAYGQTTIKTPSFSGNVNDWESLFTDAQKISLDSVCTIFAYQTNIQIALITFGAANAAKENSDAFISQTDSLFYENNPNAADVAIFLSKEFRALSFKANTPRGSDTAKLLDWKSKMQQAFTTSVQPHIQLLKDGKYADALIATVSDLAVAVKKEL